MISNWAEEIELGTVYYRASRVSRDSRDFPRARLSGVSRFKICTYELRDCSLNCDEQNRIREALWAEADRLRSITIQLEVDQSQPFPVQEVTGV